MDKNRRMAWTTFLIIGLLLPFAALFALSQLQPLGSTAAGALPATTVAAAGGESDQASAGSILDVRPGIPSAKAQAGTLFAAGDGRVVWVARPMVVGDKHLAAFEVLQRSNNSGLWSTVRPGGAAYFEGTPQGLSAAPDAPLALVFGPGGRLTGISPDAITTLASLPATQRLRAVTPSAGFVLTQGPPEPATTRPGDRLETDDQHLPFRAPDLRPLPPATATSEVAATLAASQPATLAALSETLPAPAETQPAPLVNAYAFRGASWMALPPLGSPIDPNAPSNGAAVALADAGGRLVALWIDPQHPEQLLARARPDDNADAPWGARVESPLPEPLPADARLQAVTVGRAVYIVYPVPAGKSFALIAGRVRSEPGAGGDLTFAANERLLPMFLGSAAEGVHPDADIAVAVSENALVAVIAGTDGTLRSAVFGAHGEAIVPPRPIQFVANPRDLGVGQNVGLLLVVLLMALALWRWRRDPQTPTLPTGMRTAPIPARGLAFLIDLAIPFIGVVTAMGLWEEGGFWSILDTWGAALTKPDELFSSTPLLFVLGLYTVHVAVGELFFRRSIGKAITGLQVLMIDGKAPTVAAILVRNIVRLAEIVPAGILVLYMFISDHRQRLGDLLARTIVVAPGSPDEDLPERRRKRRDEKETAGKR